ncbi:MAG: hypothetical protein U5K74_16495 [Gemmatimonadaceae bacterium]|nr:hypothetical protein [Gemmatimonadaceae bacterium]
MRIFEEVPDLDELLEARTPDLAIPGSPGPPALAACAAHLRGRFELNHRWAAVIADTTALPIVGLPRLADGARGADALRTLGRARQARWKAASASAPFDPERMLLERRILVCVYGGAGNTTLARVGPVRRGCRSARRGAASFGAACRCCGRSCSE